MNLLKEARTEAQVLIENAKKQGENNVKKLLQLLVLKLNVLKNQQNLKSNNKKKKQLPLLREQVASLSVIDCF